MAIKAKRLGSKKGIKASLSSSGSKFAQRVPEEGIELRFLQEPEDWYSVEIHYGDKNSFPCSGLDDGCLGCEEGYDKGDKWYANAYWPDEDRVIVFEMGKGVAQSILKKYDRNHTVTDRNFEVTKEGSGMQTRYDVEALDVKHIKGLSRMEPIDLDQFFEEWLDRAMREEGGDEVITATSRRRSRGGNTSSSRRRRPVPQDDDIEDDDDDDDDIEESPRARRRPAKQSTAKGGTASRKRTPRRRR